MSTMQLKDLLDERTKMVPLSVQQYHRMIESGILASGQPIELLDGFLIQKDRSAMGADPMTVGDSHAMAIAKLTWELGGRHNGWHYRSQLPVTFLPSNEPEPDGAIVRGKPDDYQGRHPHPADVLCLIEVADSSLHRDRVTKQRIYAEAVVPRYVIANLADDSVEIYDEPVAETGRYAKVQTLHRGEVFHLNLPGGQTLELRVEQILP